MYMYINKAQGLKGFIYTVGMTALSCHSLHLYHFFIILLIIWCTRECWFLFGSFGSSNDCWVDDVMRWILSHTTQQVWHTLTNVSFRMIKPWKQLRDYTFTKGEGGREGKRIKKFLQIPIHVIISNIVLS